MRSIHSNQAVDGPLGLHEKIAPTWLWDPATGLAKAAHAEDYTLLQPRPRVAPEPAVTT